MKARFVAIDEQGRVKRGVLSAENEDEARLALLEDGIYLKKFEAASDDDKVTWVARKKIQQKHQRVQQAHTGKSGSEEETPTKLRTETICLFGLESPSNGTIGMAKSGNAVFQSQDQEHRVVLDATEVEVISISGILAKKLRVVLISGKMYEFSAGFIIAKSNIRELCKKLSSK